MPIVLLSLPLYMHDYLVEHAQILTSAISPSLSIKDKALSLLFFKPANPFITFLHCILSFLKQRRRRRRMGSSDLISFNGPPSAFPPKTFLKKAKVLRLMINSRVRPTTGRRKRKKQPFRMKKRSRIWEEEEMKMVNIKLYFENKWIMEENKRLRERALSLSQENKALLVHLHSAEKSCNFSPLL